MSIRNQNWYNLQATRRYPLDDRSTGVDDNGGVIRDDILVDCHIRYPDTLGDYVYVQGITVSPGVVTIVFGAANTLTSTEGASIAAVSLPLPVAQNVNYAVRAMHPGVAGWVVLGSGVSKPFVGRYSTPIQSVIASRNARAYAPLPVSTLGKVSTAEALDGIVRLSGAEPITISHETIEISGTPRQAFVFRLSGETQGQNALQYFLGPCGQRPESGTCPKPPIETINGISPDCNGNINFTFTGFDAYPYVNCGGVDIISDVGLSEACNTGVAPSRRSRDNCDPNGGTGENDENWYDPLTQLLTSPTMLSESLPVDGDLQICASLPLCRDFGSGTATDFAVKDGIFVFDQTTAPNNCAANVVYGGAVSLFNRYTYAAANVVGVSTSIFKNCTADWAMGKTIHAELKITADGLNRNGGLVLNYIRGYAALNTQTTYLAAVIDCNRSELRLLRFNGSRFVVEHSENFQAVINKWYHLSVHPVAAGSNVAVTVRAEAADGSVTPVEFSVSVAQYGEHIGQAGFFANRSYTYFNKFKIAT